MGIWIVELELLAKAKRKDELLEALELNRLKVVEDLLGCKEVVLDKELTPKVHNYLWELVQLTKAASILKTSRQLKRISTQLSSSTC